MKARGALIAPAESVVKAKQEKEESPETQLKLSHVPQINGIHIIQKHTQMIEITVEKTAK